MVRELNHTFVMLVLKVKGAKALEVFRPIFYINTMYKIHLKLLVD